MRITKVYTRVGDNGTTRLVGGHVVRKNDLRIEAYGTLDELNSVLGIARTFNQRSKANAEVISSLETFLRTIQNDLFNVGSDLATLPADRWPNMVRVGDVEVKRLERWCDEVNEDLGPLEEFILPGGGPVGAFLHQARTVCRRAERRLLTLMEAEEDIGEGNLRYLHRLSDLLFILARWAAKSHGEPEYFWERGA